MDLVTTGLAGLNGLFAADPVTTTVSGPLGGWDEVLIRSGAFGVLTYVVTILAPQLLREMMKSRESRDQAEMEERTKREKDAREERQAWAMTLVNALATLETKFGERNSLIIRQIEMEREMCSRNHVENQAAHKEVRHAVRNISEQLALMADVAWQESNEKATAPIKRRHVPGGKPDAP